MFHLVSLGHIYSEDIEALADTAVEAHVFAFLSDIVIRSSLFQQEVIRIMRSTRIIHGRDLVFLGIFNSTFSYVIRGFHLLFTI